VFVSPGHTNRINSDADPYFTGLPLALRFLTAFKDSVLVNLGTVLRLVIKQPFIPVLCLALWSMGSAIFNKNLLSHLKTQTILWLMAAFNLYIICILPYPLYFAGLKDAAGAGSFYIYYNITFFFLLTGNILFMGVFSVKLSKQARIIQHYLTKDTFMCMTVALMLLMSLFTNSSLFRKTLSDTRNGTLRAYYNEIQKRHHELYSNNSRYHIVIRELANKPRSLFSGVDYYGSRTIYAKETFSHFLFREFVFLNAQGDTLLKYSMADELIMNIGKSKQHFSEMKGYEPSIIGFVKRYYPYYRSYAGSDRHIFFADYCALLLPDNASIVLCFAGAPVKAEPATYTISFNISEVQNGQLLYSGSQKVSAGYGDFLFIKRFLIPPGSLVAKATAANALISKSPEIGIEITEIRRQP